MEGFQGLTTRLQEVMPANNQKFLFTTKQSVYSRETSMGLVSPPVVPGVQVATQAPSFVYELRSE